MASHQSEEQNIASKLAVSFKAHSNFFRPLAAGTMSFGIKHYAGKVVYDATEFVTKNQEQKVDGKCLANPLTTQSCIFSRATYVTCQCVSQN